MPTQRSPALRTAQAAATLPQATAALPTDLPARAPHMEAHRVVRHTDRAAVVWETCLASPLDIPVAMDMDTEDIFPCPGGSGIPLALDITRDMDSVSMASVEVVVEDMAVEVVDMEEVDPAVMVEAVVDMEDRSRDVEVEAAATNRNCPPLLQHDPLTCVSESDQQISDMALFLLFICFVSRTCLDRGWPTSNPIIPYLPTY
jgi:hypothetical protein